MVKFLPNRPRLSPRPSRPRRVATAAAAARAASPQVAIPLGPWLDVVGREGQKGHRPCEVAEAAEAKGDAPLLAERVHPLSRRRAVAVERLLGPGLAIPAHTREATGTAGGGGSM